MGFDYQRYLASREWAERREAVRARCNGWCERCGVNWFREVHHLTYEHIGQEPLEDLMGLCHECHEYISAKSGYDPAKDVSFFVVAANLRKWRQKIPDWYLLMAGTSGTRLIGNIPKAQLPVIEAAESACQAIMDTARQLGEERLMVFPSPEEIPDWAKGKKATEPEEQTE